MDGEARKPSRPLRVLVAEDEPILAMLVEDTLVGLGHEVVLAPDGQAALGAAAAGGPFDVLLTDLRMPRLGGEELVRRLWARQPGLPVVVVTGHPTPDAERALRAAGGGPLSVLAKPVDIGRLAAEVVRVAATAGGGAAVRAEERLREAEARQGFLLRLGDALRPLQDAAEIQAAACRLLGGHLGVAQVGFGEVDGRQERVTVRRGWSDGRVPSIVGTRRLDDLGPAVVAGLRRGEAAAIPDVVLDPRTSAPGVAAAYAAIGTRSVLGVPLVADGRLVATLLAHHPGPRPWSPAEVELAEEACERLWAAAERARAEAALRQSEERLRLIVENARDYAIFTTDPEGRIETWLPGAAQVFGWSAEEAVGRPAAMTFTPEDRERGEPGAEAEAARTGGTAPDVRWHLRKDGSRVFIEGSATALRAPDGSLRGFLKIGQDVTGRRAAEERQALLAREVDHRARNALAVVLAALRLTPREDAAAYARAVEGRVGALARAHALLAGNGWRGADLRALAGGELAPFLAGDGGGDGPPRAGLDGPDLVLPPGAAQPLAMAFHELAANAAKHGALSVPGGRVSVSWRLDPAGGLLRLRWAEAGGPAVGGGPRRRGFGSRVLDATVRRQLGGTVACDWQATGLACELEVPLGRGPRAAAGGARVAQPARAGAAD